ncbi:MAG TPA: RodZ domain-containing protein [Pseudomonadales bacterium]
MSDTNIAVATPNDLSRSTPGEYLRKLREEKGHTHAAVSSALHLTVHYIKALEGDEYGKLPGLTFVKGYLRSYARFLGADVDNVLARFDEHITGLLDAGQHTARIERSKRRQDQALRWAIGAGLVVVAGVAAGWWIMRDVEPAATISQRAAAPAVSEPLAASTPANSIASPAASLPARQVSTPATLERPLSGAPAGEYAASASTASVNDASSSESSAINEADSFEPTAGTGQNALAAATAAGLDPPSPAASADSSVIAGAPAGSNTAAAPAAPTSTSVGTATATAVPANDTAASVTPSANGARQVSLVGAGDDELSVRFSGNSWIEVDDGNMVRLYNAMLAAGDTLTIRGQAPFRVLLGAASNASVSLNAAPVDFSSAVRADNTARLVLGAPRSGTQASETPAVQPTAASATTPVPAASTPPATSTATDAEVSQ